MKAEKQEVQSLLSGIIGTFMGRDALQMAVAALNLGELDVALLPAYLCEEVLKPFARRCRVEFYDVCPDTTIDPVVLERQLIQHRPKVVLFINYFGFLQPRRSRIKELCASSGALLIEDCAHSLLTAGSGETGDWIVHSFRKILPLPDGGGLKANRKTECLRPLFRSTIFANVLSMLIVIKSRLGVSGSLLNRASLTPRGNRMETEQGARAGAQVFMPMSTLTRRRLTRQNLDDITKRRRADFDFWLEWSARESGTTPLFDSLSAGVCPFGFPVIVTNRAQMKADLERKGLLIRTHWHLPRSVGAEFVNSHQLAQHTLTLPLDHEFDDRQRVFFRNTAPVV